MLDKTIDELIALYNVRKISRNGKIRAVLNEEGPALYFVKIGEKLSSGYQLQFLFNNSGVILKAGHSRHFSQQDDERYHLGAFSVVVDMDYLLKIAKMKVDSNQIKEERIINFYCDYSKLPDGAQEKVRQRMQATMNRYNTLFGFDPDHDGFTVGNILDE